LTYYVDTLFGYPNNIWIGLQRNIGAIPGILFRNTIQGILIPTHPNKAGGNIIVSKVNKVGHSSGDDPSYKESKCL